MDIMKVVLASLLSAASLFVIAKIIGHKQISQLDLFDYITGITLGSIGAELATELEEPIKPLAAMIVFGAVTVALSYITSAFTRTRKYINGSPTIIFNNGNLYRENMKKAKLELSEFLMMCRQEGYFSLDEIQTAVFECNGRITILPKSENRPLTPSDMKLHVPESAINTEIIMDGRIMGENLRRMGLDEVWLKRQLEKQKINSPADIFLALCGNNRKLMIYTKQK